jgi:plasmid stabilization system protein ParE
MRVRWLEQAEVDRDEIEAYYVQYNLRSAVAAGDRIHECVDLLEALPLLGHEGAIPGTREFTVRGSKSVVIYRIQGDSVVILRVIHGGQERPTVL